MLTTIYAVPSSLDTHVQLVEPVLSIENHSFALRGHKVGGSDTLAAFVLCCPDVHVGLSEADLQDAWFISGEQEPRTISGRQIEIPSAFQCPITVHLPHSVH